MKVIEQLCLSKREGNPCEDGWIVTNDFAAVVDGSTAKIKIAPNQESPGHLAMRLVCDAIKKLPKDATREDALKIFTQALADDNTYDAYSYRPTCSAVVFSNYRKEIWFIGDCQGRWNGTTHHYEKLVDRILIDIRCRAIHYYLEHGYTEEDIKKNDRGRALIFDALCDQLHFQNDPNISNPYSYPVIDGQPIRAHQIPTLSVEGAQEIILASDGYPTVCDTLEASEKALAYILTKDPLCINENPATKCLVEGNRSFDDRTYLRIDLRY